MSESVTLKSYFYEVLIPSSQKNTSSPIEDILHHVSISFMKKLALYKCFNPRTHTGCDSLKLSFTLSLPKFQSTHPHGVRRYVIRRILRRAVVSIHAPTRGATLLGDNWRVLDPCFNPRTHTGCDRRRMRCHPYPTGFQSTHPHGVRHYPLSILPLARCFNPRTHTGCDDGSFLDESELGFNPRTHTGCDTM